MFHVKLHAKSLTAFQNRGAVSLSYSLSLILGCLSIICFYIIACVISYTLIQASYVAYEPFGLLDWGL